MEIWKVRLRLCYKFKCSRYGGEDKQLKSAQLLLGCEGSLLVKVLPSAVFTS